ncbi:MAG: S8 family serine peptidase [Gemmatimonadales bacterium]
MRIASSARLRAGLASVLAFLAACSAENPTAPEQVAPSQRLVPSAPATQAAGRYVARLATGDLATASAVASRLGAKVERVLGNTGYVELSGVSAGAVATLRADAAIQRMEPDLRQQWIRPLNPRLANTTPVTGVRAQGSNQSGAFFFPIQWNIARVHAPDGWVATPAGAGALVCVLDTGVDDGQLDLVGKVDLSKSGSTSSTEPFLADLNGHGTYVSSLISSNGIGMASVAPDAMLCAVKVLDASGFGSFFDVAAGIVFAADQGADVISLSLSGVVPVDDPVGRFFMALLEAAAHYANDQGALVVAAAGNDGANLDLFPQFKIAPAHLRRVIGVSALAPFAQTKFDGFAPYSNSGVKLVSVAAPGGDFQPGGVVEDLVLGACARIICGGDGFYFFASGTSGAAPHVAAVAAVVESFKAGDQDAAALQQCVLSGAVRVPTLTPAQQGAGRVDVMGAVRRC